MPNLLKVSRLEEELNQCEAVLKSRRVKPVIITKSNSRFKKFQRTYVNDPLAFLHDCIITPPKWIWASYQEEVIGEMLTRQRQALYGPRGLGKSTLASVLIWWSVLTSDDTITPTTASSWRQLDKYLWPEIHRLHRMLNWDIIGRTPLVKDRELKTLSIDITKTQSAFAVASNDPDKIEGAHANFRVFIVIDESKAVKDDTFDSLEGAHSQCEQPLALALSTPGPKLGRFYDICTGKFGYEDWTVVPVTKDQAIAAGRMRSEWAEQRARQWGTDSAIYRNHVLGEFAQDSERVIIPLHYVELANQRWEEREASQTLGNVDTIGVDPARGGGDMSTIAMGNKSAIIAIRELDVKDIMPTADAVLDIMTHNPLSRAVIDVIGVGAGVYDHLRRLGKKVLPFNAAEKSLSTDRSGTLSFINKRAEVWWKMSEALNPAYNSDIALPPGDRLLGELTTPTYDYDRQGRIVVQSKEDIRKHIGRSTDWADACISVIVGAEACSQCETEVLAYSDYVNQQE